MQRLQELCTSVFQVSLNSATRGVQSPEEASRILLTLSSIGEVLKEETTSTVASGQRPSAGGESQVVSVLNTVVPMVVQSISMLFRKDRFVRASVRQREACLLVLLHCVEALSASQKLALCGQPSSAAPTASCPGEILNDGHPALASGAFSADTFHVCVACCEVALNSHVTNAAAEGTSQSVCSDEEKTYSVEVLLVLLRMLALELRGVHRISDPLPPPTASSGSSGISERRLAHHKSVTDSTPILGETASTFGAQQVLAELISWEKSGARVGFWISAMLSFAAQAKSAVRLQVASLRCVRRLFEPFPSCSIIPGCTGTNVPLSFDGTVRVPYIWHFVPGVASKVFEVVKTLCEVQRYSRVVVEGVSLWREMLRACFSCTGPWANRLIQKRADDDNVASRLASLFAHDGATKEDNSLLNRRSETSSSLSYDADSNSKTAESFFSGGNEDGGPHTSWLEDTASKLHLLLTTGLRVLRSHPNRSVRHAGHTLASTVAAECGLVLLPTVPDCLEYMLGVDDAASSIEPQSNAAEPDHTSLQGRRSVHDVIAHLNVHLDALASGDKLCEKTQDESTASSTQHLRAGFASYRSRVWSFIFTALERRLAKEALALPRLARGASAEPQLQFSFEFIRKAALLFATPSTENTVHTNYSAFGADEGSGQEPTHPAVFKLDTAVGRVIQMRLSKLLPRLCDALCDVGAIDIDHTLRKGFRFPGVREGSSSLASGTRGFDVPAQTLLSGSDITKSPSTLVGSYPIRFLHLTQTETIKKFINVSQQMCRGLSLSAGAYTIWDHLQSSAFRINPTPATPQALLLMQQLVIGVWLEKQKSVDERARFLRFVCTETIAGLAAMSRAQIDASFNEKDSTAMVGLSASAVEALSTAFKVQLAGLAFVNYAEILTMDASEVAIDELLSQLLFPLLEHLGAHNPALVVDAAFVALQRIATFKFPADKTHHEVASDSAVATTPAAGVGPVGMLLVQNIDYLMDSLSYQLDNLSDFPHAPDTLSALWQHAGTAAHPLLRDTVRGVLRSIDDHRRLRTSVSELITERLIHVVRNCANVLGQSAVQAPLANAPVAENSRQNRSQAPRRCEGKDMQHWWVDRLARIAQYTLPLRDSCGGNEGDMSDNETVAFETPARFFKRYHAEKQKRDEKQTEEGSRSLEKPDFETDSDDDSESDGAGMTENIDVESRTVREQAELLGEVLSRCIHFLTWPKVRLQLVLLDTIDTAMRALSTLDSRREQAIRVAQDELERKRQRGAKCADVEFSDDPRLLPAIHNIWPALAPLLGDLSGSRGPLTHVIHSAALRVLTTLTDCASSFIRQRFRTDIWPTMREHMQLLVSWSRSTSYSRKAPGTGLDRGQTDPDSAIGEILEARAEEAAATKRRTQSSVELALAKGQSLGSGGSLVAAAERLQPRVARVTLCRMLDFLTLATQKKLFDVDDVSRAVARAALQCLSSTLALPVAERKHQHEQSDQTNSEGVPAAAMKFLQSLLRANADSVWMLIARAASCTSVSPSAVSSSVSLSTVRLNGNGAISMVGSVLGVGQSVGSSQTARADVGLAKRAQELLLFAESLAAQRPLPSFPAFDFFEFGPHVEIGQ